MAGWTMNKDAAARTAIMLTFGNFIGVFLRSFVFLNLGRRPCDRALRHYVAAAPGVQD
jgi:hypothetical protein